MDEIFGDQLVPHALEDSEGAETAMAQLEEKGGVAATHSERV